jgi:iron complex outermembrane receptor protein
MNSIFCSSRVVLIALGVLSAASHATGAQVAGVQHTIRGRVVHAATLAPIAGASVLVEETRLQVGTAKDGTFTLAGVAAGACHLVVVAPGFIAARIEIAQAGTADPVIVALNPELHYTEVVSVSPNRRDQFEAYQATSVLAGQDLALKLEGSLGASLASEPGVAERSFGPGPSRPVIRGFDGDRVLILENGQRTGDLSSQSADHGVNINPAAATRLEVVRGPATLLYGASAIGGLVNVITGSVPTAPATGVSGGSQVEVGSAAAEAAVAADVLAGNGRWAFRAGGSARRTGDVETPEGEVANSQSRSAFGDVGLSWTSARGFLGGSYAYDDTRYGLPYVEEGRVELTPRRQAFNLRGEARNLTGAIQTLRGSVGHRRYRHDEVVAGAIGTVLENNSTEVELLANHRAAGRLEGTIGGWGLVRAFSASGEEALSPPVDQHGLAFFAYEEVTWPHATLQFGGRFERATFSPHGEAPDRSFNSFSASVGLLLRPSDATTVAVSLARAVRNPALEELYFFGPHPGNFAFEIGNPALKSEQGLGFDVSYRWRLPRVSGEVSYFRNDIKDYVFRNPIEVDEAHSRFGGALHDDEDHDDLPFVEFVAADSVLQGIEMHADVHVTARIVAEMGLDYVRGELKAARDPLPRMPPLRVKGGLRYQWNAFQAGGEITGTARQGRVFDRETETAGYGLLKLFAAYSFQTGKAVSTLTARLDNATNELYRNHLSYIKDFVPEMGRNLKVVYGVKF